MCFSVYVSELLQECVCLWLQLCVCLQLQAGLPTCHCVFGLVGVPMCAHMCGYSGEGLEVPPPHASHRGPLVLSLAMKGLLFLPLGYLESSFWLSPGLPPY